MHNFTRILHMLLFQGTHTHSHTATDRQTTFSQDKEKPPV